MTTPYICTACNVEHDPMMDRQLGMVCARCNQHTGNYHQGHYWGFCKVLAARGVKQAVRGLHFCCPGNCERELQP